MNFIIRLLCGLMDKASFNTSLLRQFDSKWATTGIVDEDGRLDSSRSSLGFGLHNVFSSRTGRCLALIPSHLLGFYIVESVSASHLIRIVYQIWGSALKITPLCTTAFACFLNYDAKICQFKYSSSHVFL